VCVAASAVAPAAGTGAREGRNGGPPLGPPSRGEWRSARPGRVSPAPSHKAYPTIRSTQGDEGDAREIFPTTTLPARLPSEYCSRRFLDDRRADLVRTRVSGRRRGQGRRAAVRPRGPLGDCARRSAPRGHGPQPVRARVNVTRRGRERGDGCGRQCTRSSLAHHAHRPRARGRHRRDSAHVLGAKEEASDVRAPRSSTPI
jgi:hypothetical protein